MPERYEHMMLHASGAIPGIPGMHGPGPLVVDWQERKGLSIDEWNALTLPEALLEAQKKTAKPKASKEGV